MQAHYKKLKGDRSLGEVFFSTEIFFIFDPEMLVNTISSKTVYIY